MFWSIPDSDLEKVKDTWEEAIKVFRRGVKFTYKPNKTENDLPKSKFNGVSHVRPKGTDSNDVDELPNGGFITKQCFWLNNSYISEVIGLDKKIGLQNK